MRSENSTYSARLLAPTAISKHALSRGLLDFISIYTPSGYAKVGRSASQNVISANFDARFERFGLCFPTIKIARANAARGANDPRYLVLLLTFSHHEVMTGQTQLSESENLDFQVVNQWFCAKICVFWLVFIDVPKICPKSVSEFSKCKSFMRNFDFHVKKIFWDVTNYITIPLFKQIYISISRFGALVCTLTLQFHLDFDGILSIFD